MFVRKIALAAILLGWLAGTASAQNEASIVGNVTDESKAVVVNVLVTATETASGRSYSAKTDERGAYRISSVQPGTYRIQAEADGFATGVVQGVEILVGQVASISLTMKLGQVQQTVDVTAERPLLNSQTQEIGGNIDRRQMQELPILGRNWLELSMLVKGVTANDVSGNRPGVARDDQFQLNLDGQQITQGLGTASAFGQPRLSREAISEYQLVTNQFDIAQGRSGGSQVQAVSRSGSNDMHGSFYGNFQNDAFNASDFVAHRVLPYSDTQLGGSFGGPVIKDKLHYFGTYEHESQPNTILLSPQIYAPQTFSVASNNTQYNILLRADYVASAKDHVTFRGSFWDYRNPATGLTTGSYPTAATIVHRYSPQYTGIWTHVFNNNTVQEVRAGYYKYFWITKLAAGVPATPAYAFGQTLSVGATSFYPESFWESMPSISWNLAWHHGTHDLKFGAEVLFRHDYGYWPNNQRGSISFSTTPTNLVARFPLSAWNDPSKWDLSGLDSSVSSVTQNFSNDWNISTPRKTYAFWAGDTWHPTPRLTITAGLRYDLDWGSYAVPGINTTSVFINNGSDGPNFDVGYHNGVRSSTNISPRGGIAYRFPGNWVWRMGGGVFYGEQESNLAWGLQRNNGQVQLNNTYFNDGKPGFLQNWTRGVTGQDYFSGKVPIPVQAVATIAPDFRDPRSVTGTAGFQKQIGSSLSFDSDFVYTKGNFLGDSRNVNQFRDPVTGYPLNPNPPFSNPRPTMAYQSITLYESNLFSDYAALASSITRRLKNRWQAGATYTLMFRSNDEGTNSFGYIGNVNNPFCTRCEYGRNGAFQRNTVRINAIYQGPWGLTLSGIFYYGSGNYYNPGYLAFTPQNISLAGGFFGTNRLVVGPAPVVIPANMVDRFGGISTIPVGGLLPRNSFQGLPLYKVDMRLSKDLKIRERFVITGMLELFNVLNHPNYGGYNTTANLAGFGTPVQNASTAYVPRELQLAFRVGF
jgi:hypothetical protein